MFLLGFNTKKLLELFVYIDKAIISEHIITFYLGLTNIQT